MFSRSWVFFLRLRSLMKTMSQMSRPKAVMMEMSRTGSWYQGRKTWMGMVSPGSIQVVPRSRCWISMVVLPEGNPLMLISGSSMGNHSEVDSEPVMVRYRNLWGTPE